MKNLRTGTAKFDTIRAKDASGLHIQDDAGNGLFIKDGGNVGIGTTNPDLTGLQLGTALVVSSATGGDIVAHKSGSSVNVGDICGSLLIANSDIDGAEDHFVGMWGKASSTNGSQNLYFAAGRSGYEGDAPHMTILSDGNVGIGTTNPATKLEIAGNVRINGGEDTGSQLVQWCDNNGHANIAAFDIFFKTGQNQSRTDSMVINSNGNVGIGTTSPQSKFTIKCADLTNEGGLRMIKSSIDNAYFDNYINAEGNLLWAYNDQNLITLNANGKVGIGTTSPSYELEVESSSPVIGVTSTTSSAPEFRLENTLKSWANYLDNAGELVWLNRSDSKEAMRIDSDGNVGIGTTNPISVHNRDSVLVVGGGTGMETSGITLGIGSGYSNGPYEIFTSSEGSLASLRISDGTDARLTIRSNGNVGIGTTSPGSYKLHVNGTLKIYDTSYVGANEITSDDRVKHNEQPIVGALETLGKITPKKYIKTTEMYDANHDFELDADGNPIDENGEPVEHRIEAGVIAQQVLTVDELAFAVSPEGVDEDGVVTSPHGLDYNSLFTYAIAAIQEQQEIIETQNSRIDELTSRIETLEQ